ncbi:Fis family transcriptional regulator [Hymenobacter sedentarius]|uniref:Fis family transcriptional regulator n=1 Tax=Hymenobacter sedentarius TaxID=1411621 RepID=A0A0U4CDP3_9BACT|nr:MULTISPECIES: response regulator [Hymenobacter]ALW86297.1 Fis family transcriptional regulator [Hymenobacter sedentarius]MCC3154561.1 response regulator [Hymenobacter sp. BT770]MDO3416615.1 response regulator [Hymenobacter sp. BT770]
MKILVVDDELDVKLLFEQRFRREIRDGLLSFAFAFSGEEALNYLSQEQHYSEVVLILSDINMPGMSGLELLRNIKVEHPIPPPTVMIITAYGDSESYSKAMQLGASDFLVKPIDFTLLKQKLMPLSNS